MYVINVCIQGRFDDCYCLKIINLIPAGYITRHEFAHNMHGRALTISACDAYIIRVVVHVILSLALDLVCNDKTYECG